MANTLRVPMSRKINQLVSERQFDLADAPFKELVPLYDHSFIMQLNELVINEAYIPLGNIVLTTKDGSIKATFLDTEPLYGEMCVENRSENLFFRNNQILNRSRTLNAHAKDGLKQFGSSAYKIEAFANVSQTFLEKMD